MHVLRAHRRVATFIAVRLVLATVEMTTIGGRLATAGPANTVVVHYAETLGELAGPDRGPSLTIHEDGRFDVHYPPYMKRGGDYRGRLSPAALDALVGRLVEHGVLDFDPAAVRGARAGAAERRAARARALGEPSLFAVTDPSVTTITLRRDGIERTVSWSGLRDDARRFSGIAPLQGLRAAELDLRALMEREDLRRVE